MILWTDAERDQIRASGHQWQYVVHQTHRRRHPWRVKFAQLLRLLVVWVEP